MSKNPQNLEVSAKGISLHSTCTLWKTNYSQIYGIDLEENKASFIFLKQG